MTTHILPDARCLTRAQYTGWTCVWCGKPLTTGATPAGRAVGSIGAHRLDVDVYQCPDCTQPARRADEEPPTQTAPAAPVGRRHR